MQLIVRVKQIFDEANLALYLRPYQIIVTSNTSGFMECVPNSISLDGLKKMFPKRSWKLNDFYRRYYYFNYEESVKNFTESLAGYSFFNYLFNVKDRHNGNILLTKSGHLVHIDFGFIFTSAPGGFNFENAPFKLTSEYMNLMGGPQGEMFTYFKSLLTKAFFEVRKHIDDLIGIIEVMFTGSNMDGFVRGEVLF